MGLWARPFLILALALSGCTFSMNWFRQYRAERAIERQDFATALSIFKRTVDNDPDSAQALKASRQGARVAHLDAKNYALAVEFYKHVVLRSPDSTERKAAQRFIAQIYFENLQDYDQAVVEYEKLLKNGGRPDETFGYRLNLAKSHFHLNNLDQALNEIEVLLAQPNVPEQVFETKILKANIMIAAKRQSEAATLWESILRDFPEKSQKENVALNLVVCYEEMKEFGKAIEVLESMRETDAHPEFLNMRIQRLKERKENQPGAQGLRK